MPNKTVVMCPTESEAVDLRGVLPEGVEIVISGVGMAETAASVVRVLTSGKPDMLILAGIAGAYPGSGLNVGDCVVVDREHVADQGAFRDGTFTLLYALTYPCETAERIVSLPLVEGCTVSAAAGSFGDFGMGKVESMEGAAFFAVCMGAGVPFLEVRAVSNLTTASRGEWRMDIATRSLAEGVVKVIAELAVRQPDSRK